MRRALIVIGVLLIALQVQPKGDPITLPRNDDGNVEYKKVVHVEGASARDLYVRAKGWAAGVYNATMDDSHHTDTDSATASDITININIHRRHTHTNLFLVDDPDSGTLVIRGYFRLTKLAIPTFIRQTVTIQVKEGRFRYTLNDIHIEMYDDQKKEYSSIPLEKCFNKKGEAVFGRKALVKMIDSNTQALLAKLVKAMKQTEDDW